MHAEQGPVLIKLDTIDIKRPLLATETKKMRNEKISEIT